MEQCLKIWCSKEELKEIRSLPLIIFWFIWKARNLNCFEDHLLMLLHVSIQSLGVLRFIPQDHIFLKTKMIVEEPIDKSFPWGYFDGSVVGVPRICGTGGIIYFSY